MRVKNSQISYNTRLPTMCELCMSSDVHKLSNLELENENLKQKVEALEQALAYFKNKDSIIKNLKKHFPHDGYQKMNNVLLYKSLEPLPYLQDDDPVLMVTQTFDPAKFPVLNNRVSQRAYIKQVLEVAMIDHLIFQGCFELHKTGVVHSHFIVIKNIDKENLKQYFTKNKSNEYCINFVQKTYKEAYDYITKDATKDADNSYNYFQRNDIEKLDYLEMGNF